MVRKSRFSRLRPAAKAPDAARIPAGGPPPASDGSAAEIVIVAACPECGAPVEMAETAAAAACGFCASLLAVDGGGAVRHYRMQDAIGHAGALAEIVIEEAMLAKRAEIFARKELSADDDHPQGLALSLLPTDDRLELCAHEAQVRRSTRVREASLFYAPYWHFDRLLITATLLREARSRTKRIDVSLDDWEVSIPAYPGAINLRDERLRINSAHVELLTRGEAGHDFPALPAETELARAIEELPHAMAADLGGADELVTWLRPLPLRARLVYKPYWSATIDSEGVTRQLLVDGTYRRIAGNFAIEEGRALARLLSPGPVYPEQPPRVRVAAFECPVCGDEAPSAAHRMLPIIFCKSCHRALARNGAALDELAYLIPADLHATGRDAVWLPAYRVAVRYRYQGTAIALGELSRLLAPPMARDRVAGSLDHLYVPAFPTFRPGRPGSHSIECLRACRALLGSELRLVTGRIPLDLEPRLIGTALSPGHARELACAALYLLPDRVAHLTSAEARLLLEPESLVATGVELLVLPYRDDGDRLISTVGLAPAPRGLLLGGAT